MFGFFDEIVKKIEEWLDDWISGGDKKDPDPNLMPVLLIPGIGASILNAVDDENSDKQERVWVRLFFADHEFKKKLWSLYDPATGKTISLDPKSHIEVPDDNYGLFSCDILDPAVFIRLNIVYNFHDLIKQMQKWGYEEGTTLFGYGYDFRQSNRLPDAVDGLRKRLEAIHKISGGRKVNIISHSMGGLLVKSFLALHPDLFETLVNSWTTISTPFQGAPAFITDCLLTGVEFLKGWQKELWVAKWSTHQLLVECPSVYEMMASLTHKWERPPQLRVWKSHKPSNDDQTHAKLHCYGPLECVSIMEAALKDNTLCYDGKTIPLPFNRAILEWSNQSRHLWLSAKLPEGVKFYNIYGTSCETPFDICYGNEDEPLDELKEILHTEAEFVCVDGDGTVPSESSKADGFNATARYAVAGDHRGLLRSSEVFLLIKDILQVDKEDRSLKASVAVQNKLRSLSEQVVQKEEHICVPASTATLNLITSNNHNNNNWDAISEDSQDYNENEEVEDAVVVIQTRGARAQARTSGTLHEEAHDGYSEPHIKLSTFGVAEGRDKKQASLVLEEAMVSAIAKFKGMHPVPGEPCKTSSTS